MCRSKLYGINNSNRNFLKKESWGKNIFNNTFPISLTCYMKDKKNMNPIYIKVDSDFNITKEMIDINNILATEINSEDTYFNFEAKFNDYREYVEGDFPNIDLVIQEGNIQKNPLEIKLTTLPDNSTYKEDDDTKYGSEIVIRPGNILYQALSILHSFNEQQVDISDKFKSYVGIDWTSEESVLRNIHNIKNELKVILSENTALQKPLMLQSIWKTNKQEKSLEENCFDIFVWSDFSFAKLFLRDNNEVYNKIKRPDRCAIWLYLMLYKYTTTGSINYKEIIDRYTYNTKNDKAFSVNGKITNQLMRCNQLTNPRVNKNEIKKIILNDGQDFLSPERRLDAYIFIEKDSLFIEEAQEM